MDKRKSRVSTWRKLYTHAPDTQQINIDSPLWESLCSDCKVFVHETKGRFALEKAARGRIAWLGRALESGGDIPPEAAQWLGRALVEIARGENAEAALGLGRPRGKPKDLGTQAMIAAWVYYLVHRGLSQNKAADMVAEHLGLAETKEIKHLHNQLKARIGTFSHVEGLTLWESLAEVGRIEAISLLTPGGSYGFGIPDKWATIGGLNSSDLDT